MVFYKTAIIKKFYDFFAKTLELTHRQKKRDRNQIHIFHFKTSSIFKSVSKVVLNVDWLFVILAPSKKESTPPPYPLIRNWIFWNFGINENEGRKSQRKYEKLSFLLEREGGIGLQYVFCQTSQSSTIRLYWQHS